MGSIMSFPVLCIGNAAMCRWAIELAEKKKIRLMDAQLAINGDDVALRAHRSVHRFWSRITRFAGLTESVGKTFVSRHFVMINSTMYQREKLPHRLVENEKRETYLRFVPYVHMGILFGKGRAGTSRDDEISGTIGALARSVVEKSPPKMASAILDLFILLNKTELTDSRLPWFMPEWIGGLGLPTGVSTTYGNSDKDFRVANRILRNWNTVAPAPPSTSGESKWMIRRLTAQYIPNTTTTTSKDKSYQALKKLEGNLAVDLLFNSDFGLSDLFNEDDGAVYNDSNRVNRNVDLWRIGKGKLPPPLSEDILFNNPRYTALAVTDIYETKTNISNNNTHTLFYPTKPKTTTELFTEEHSKSADIVHYQPPRGGFLLD
jgi:hypothetical protein